MNGTACMVCYKLIRQNYGRMTCPHCSAVQVVTRIEGNEVAEHIRIEKVDDPNQKVTLWNL